MRIMLSRKILAITAMGVLVCLLGMDRAGAFNQDDLARLLKTKQCSDCDLSEANLSGADLSRTWLPGADLTNANLSNAWLSGACLVGADLSGADLFWANLSWATWTDGRQCAEDSFGGCK
jgi:uncharacterized protein YjbI with pentapeptide repeats